MYNDPQEEIQLSLYQTKKQTETTRDYVDDILYILDGSNVIPKIINEALESEYIIIEDNDELASLILNKNIPQSRKLLKDCLTRYVTYIFDELFAWSDETLSYYEV